MSITTEILSEKIRVLDKKIEETTDDSERQTLSEERERVAATLVNANKALNESKMLLKG